MSTIDFDILLDNRSDPDVRMVLEDAELSMGRRSTRLGLALSIARGDADADADAAADAAADSADAADAAAAAAADAADAARRRTNIDIDAAAFNAGAAASSLTALLQEEIDMRNGLKVIQVLGLNGSRSVTRIGWVRRSSGDEYEVVNARTIIRTGAQRTLDSLATEGPGEDHTLTPTAKEVEEFHRLTIKRCVAANINVWAEHCPQPEGW